MLQDKNFYLTEIWKDKHALFLSYSILYCSATKHLYIPQPPLKTETGTVKNGIHHAHVVIQKFKIVTLNDFVSTFNIWKGHEKSLSLSTLSVVPE